MNDIETVLTRVGIKIRDNANTWRDIDDILEDIGEKWDSWDTTTQNAVSTVVAGTRQRENVITLFENWDDVSKYAEIAENAYGTATEKMEAYSDSVEASKKRITAAVEKLALDLDISEKMKTVYSAIANITENLWAFATALGVLKLDSLLTGVGEGITKLSKRFMAMGIPKGGGLLGGFTAANNSREDILVSNYNALQQTQYSKKFSAALASSNFNSFGEGTNYAISGQAAKATLEKIKAETDLASAESQAVIRTQMSNALSDESYVIKTESLDAETKKVMRATVLAAAENGLIELSDEERAQLQDLVKNTGLLSDKMNQVTAKLHKTGANADNLAVKTFLNPGIITDPEKVKQQAKIASVSGGLSTVGLIGGGIIGKNIASAVSDNSTVQTIGMMLGSSMISKGLGGIPQNLANYKAGKEAIKQAKDNLTSVQATVKQNNLRPQAQLAKARWRLEDSILKQVNATADSTAADAALANAQTAAENSSQEYALQMRQAGTPSQIAAQRSAFAIRQATLLQRRDEAQQKAVEASQKAQRATQRMSSAQDKVNKAQAEADLVKAQGERQVNEAQENVNQAKTNATTMGSVMGPIILMAAMAAISFGVSQYNKKIDELKQTFSDAAAKYNDVKASTTTAEKYDSLAKGVNAYGENVSLSDDEYSQFVEYSNELAELFPSLVVRVDEAGNKFVGLGGSVGGVTSSIEDLIDAAERAANNALFKEDGFLWWTSSAFEENLKDVQDDAKSTHDSFWKEHSWEDRETRRKEGFEEAGLVYRKNYIENGRYEWGLDEDKIKRQWKKTAENPDDNDAWEAYWAEQQAAAAAVIANEEALFQAESIELEAQMEEYNASMIDEYLSYVSYLGEHGYSEIETMMDNLTSEQSAILTQALKKIDVTQDDDAIKAQIKSIATSMPKLFNTLSSQEFDDETLLTIAAKGELDFTSFSNMEESREALFNALIDALGVDGEISDDDKLILKVSFGFEYDGTGDETDIANYTDTKNLKDQIKEALGYTDDAAFEEAWNNLGAESWSMERISNIYESANSGELDTSNFGDTELVSALSNDIFADAATSADMAWAKLYDYMNYNASYNDSTSPDSIYNRIKEYYEAVGAGTENSKQEIARQFSDLDRNTRELIYNYGETIDSATGDVDKQIENAMEGMVSSIRGESITLYMDAVKQQVSEAFSGVDFGTDGIINSFSEVKDAIDAITESFDKLQTAQDEYNSTGHVTWQTAYDLLSVNAEYASVLDTSTGKITLMGDAEEQIAKIQAEALKESMNAAAIEAVQNQASLEAKVLEMRALYNAGEAYEEYNDASYDAAVAKANERAEIIKNVYALNAETAAKSNDTTASQEWLTLADSVTVDTVDREAYKTTYSGKQLEAQLATLEKQAGMYWDAEKEAYTYAAKYGYDEATGAVTIEQLDEDIQLGSNLKAAQLYLAMFDQLEAWEESGYSESFYDNFVKSLSSSDAKTLLEKLKEITGTIDKDFMQIVAHNQNWVNGLKEATEETQKIADNLKETQKTQATQATQTQVTKPRTKEVTTYSFSAPAGTTIPNNNNTSSEVQRSINTWTSQLENYQKQLNNYKKQLAGIAHVESSAYGAALKDKIAVLENKIKEATVAIQNLNTELETTHNLTNRGADWLSKIGLDSNGTFTLEEYTTVLEEAVAKQNSIITELGKKNNIDVSKISTASETLKELKDELALAEKGQSNYLRVTEQTNTIVLDATDEVEALTTAVTALADATTQIESDTAISELDEYYEQAKKYHTLLLNTALSTLEAYDVTLGDADSLVEAQSAYYSATSDSNETWDNILEAYNTGIEEVKTLASLENDRYETAISIMETLHASNALLATQYEMMIATYGQDDSAIQTKQQLYEYQEKLNEAIKEQLGLEQDLLEFQKEVMDIQMEYLEGMPINANYETVTAYNKLFTAMEQNLKDQISKTKEITKTTYDQLYESKLKAYKEALDSSGKRLYSDEDIAAMEDDGTIEQEVQMESEYQEAMKAYLEAQQALGDLYYEDFENKIDSIERKITKLETSKSNEWASSWNEATNTVIEGASAIDKIKAYYGDVVKDADEEYIKNISATEAEAMQGLGGYYVQVAKAAYETLINYSEMLTDEQIEELVEKYNDAMKNIRDNAVSLYEDIKTYQEAVYSALTSEVERYKEQLEEQKEIVEDYYDTELEKLNDKNTSIERTNKLIELQNNLLNAQEERTRVYRAGIGWTYESNRDKIKEAEDALDEFYLQDSIDDLTNTKEAELDALETRIQNWDDYLSMLESRYEEYDRLEQEKLLMELLGVSSEEEVQSIIEQDMLSFTTYMNNHLTDFFDDQISAFANFNTTFAEFLNDYKENLEALNDFEIEPVNVIEETEFITDNDDYVAETVAEALGETYISSNKKTSTGSLYDVVENDTRILSNSSQDIDESKLDKSLGNGIVMYDYSALMYEAIKSGNYTEAIADAIYRDAKMENNEETHGGYSSTYDLLVEYLEEAEVSDEETAKVLQQYAQASANRENIETAINNQELAYEAESTQALIQLSTSIPNQLQVATEEKILTELSSLDYLKTILGEDNTETLSEQIGLNGESGLSGDIAGVGTAITNDIAGVGTAITNAVGTDGESGLSGDIAGVGTAITNDIAGVGTAITNAVGTDGENGTGIIGKLAALGVDINDLLDDEEGIPGAFSESADDLEKALKEDFLGADGKSGLMKTIEDSNTDIKNAVDAIAKILNNEAGVEETQATQIAESVVADYIGIYDWYEDTVTSTAEDIQAQMEANSAAWYTADSAEQTRLHEANEKLAAELAALTGESITYESNGTWNTSSGRLYADGIENGPVTYTGLAMLHGTPSSPEYVLNNSQAYSLLRYMSTSTPEFTSNLSGAGDTIYDFGGITINECDNAEEFFSELNNAMSARYNITRHRK